MKKKTPTIDVEFFGYPSGDYESFCFDVPKETFIELMGMKPTRHDKSYFNKKTYRVYLQDLVKTPYGKQCLFKIKIEVKELDKPITI